VIDYSSQFGSVDWSASRALGPPDVYPTYGDMTHAWASQVADNQAEFLDLGYAHPAPINFVSVYETFHPGALTRVSVRNPNTESLGRVLEDLGMAPADRVRAFRGFCAAAEAFRKAGELHERPQG